MGVMNVNDRCVSLLENYELEVLRTFKGRGAILCETNMGTMILKEYSGHKEKCQFQDAVLSMIQNNGFVQIESIIRNKEGEILTTDQDEVCYILKTYFEGRECNVRDQNDCIIAMETLARLHKASQICTQLPAAGKVFTVKQEFEKHNKELKRAKKFLKEKSQKSDFEIYLLKCYEYFLQLALKVSEEYNARTEEKEENKVGIICHGDFQHHNLIFEKGMMNVVNFEKSMPDSPARDICLFMRKLLEKNNWQKEVGFELLAAYEKENSLYREDYIQLYYRLAYPEKFWKIVNFYYNSGKAWIPGKNFEKLLKINEQESPKTEFLQSLSQKYDIM